MEGHYATGRNGYFLASLGVASRPLRLGAKLEITESGELDAGAILEGFADFLEEAFDHILCLALVQTHALEQQVGLPSVGPVSKLPPVRRDLNIVVDEHVPAQALVDAMLKEKPAPVAQIQVFDVYRGSSLPKGKKSVAFLVLMQDTQRTLTDAEVDAAMELMGSTLRDRFKATPR